MSMLPSKQEVSKTPEPRQQRGRHVLAVVAALSVLVTLILNNLGVFHNPWSTILSAIFSALTLILSLPFSPDALKWLFFSSTDESDQSSTVSSPSTLSSTTKITYSRIRREPPSTDLDVIQKREAIVKEIYEKLQQPDLNALVLTGITGSGKSTIAALLYQHAESQRRIHHGLFTAKTLWFQFDATSDVATNMMSFSRQLWISVGKRISEFNRSGKYRILHDSFNELKKTKRYRLIVIDNLDAFLDWKTGRVLPACPEISEWISEVNSKKYHCRFLLTSRAFPQETKPSPQIYMREFCLNCLQTSEGVELLRKYGLKATDADLSYAVKRCAGHVLTLIALAVEVLREDLDLPSLTDPKIAQIRMEEIAHEVFDSVYTETLKQDQEILSVVVALSAYREPVTFDTLQFLFSPKMIGTKIRDALKVLRTQNLLLHVSITDCYQLHPIFTDYVRDYCKRHDEEILRTMHVRAAQGYLQEVTANCPPRGRRQQSSDIASLIEAVWHQCKAEKYQEAYDLIQQEGIFADLHRWGDNMILLELYQLLLPLEKWGPEPSQVVLIYSQLGKIYEDLGQKELAQKYKKLAKANAQKGKV